MALISLKTSAIVQDATGSLTVAAGMCFFPQTCSDARESICSAAYAAIRRAVMDTDPGK